MAGAVVVGALMSGAAVFGVGLGAAAPSSEPHAKQ
jgi:hypothetical protein